MSLRGFGFTFDTQTGGFRHWEVGADGIKRWTDTGQPVEQPHPTQEADK